MSANVEICFPRMFDCRNPHDRYGFVFPRAPFVCLYFTAMEHEIRQIQQEKNMSLEKVSQ